MTRPFSHSMFDIGVASSADRHSARRASPPSVVRAPSPAPVATVVDALGIFGSWAASCPPVDRTDDIYADAYLAGAFSSLTRVRDSESRLASLVSRCRAMAASREAWAPVVLDVLKRWHLQILEADLGVDRG